MRVGSIQFATDQGIAMLAKSFYEAGVITDMIILRHGSRHRPTHTEWYPEGTPVVGIQGLRIVSPEVMEVIKSVDVMLFFETPFEWELLTLCKRLGKPTVIVPMYECTPRIIPRQPTKWICPSLLDVDYFPGSEFIPIPVSKIPWNQRTTATKFLHNGGHLGLRGHKGTLELLDSMRYVDTDLTLHVRAQDDSGLRAILEKLPEAKEDKRITFEFGDIPYENLFLGYDVLVAPEKYNGLSLPLQEGRAAGMLVVTSDRFPHNAWLPVNPLIPVRSYSKQRIGSGYMEYDEALIHPWDIAKTLDRLYRTDITEYSREGAVYAEQMSWESLKPVWMEALAL